MLLSRTNKRGEEGKAEFFERFRQFQSGEWVLLIHAARIQQRSKKPREGGMDSSTAEEERRKREAHLRVFRGEVSHARQALVGMAIAPGNDATRAELMNEERRPKSPRSPQELAEVSIFKPENPVELDVKLFYSNIRSAKRGISGGLSGMRNEHLKCIAYSPRTADMASLYTAANILARAEIPAEIKMAVALARMTALDKGKGKVRGIATGDTFRRAVAKTLAQQFAEEFDKACSPFQFALSTRAGTDCVGHALREISKQHPEKVIINLAHSFPASWDTRTVFQSKNLK